MATATALSTGHVTEVGTEAEWKDILSQAQEEDKTVCAAPAALECMRAAPRASTKPALDVGRPALHDHIKPTPENRLLLTMSRWLLTSRRHGAAPAA